MRKLFFYATLLGTFSFFLTACTDKTKSGAEYVAFDANQPIQVEGFYPDSGGIATPMIVEGRNFGSDTIGMRVYFEDVEGVKHRAGLVSSNGSKIYMLVPSGLTYKKEMNIIVERTTSDGKVYSGKAEEQFLYKTQTTVTTVIGQAAPDNGNLPTKGGDLTSATLSAPCYICLDNEDNVFISERTFDNQEGRSDVYARNEKGEGVSGNLVMASLKSNSVIVLKYGTNIINAPAFSDEKDNEQVFVPEDPGTGYYQMVKALNYAPRLLRLLKTEATKTIDEGNWKHGFVVNKIDKSIYTVMWKGQLVRINPRTRVAEILLKKVGTAGDGSDSYIAFSPVPGQENMLYISLADQNQIWRVNIADLEGKPEDYRGEPYAGKAILEGKQAGKGWEDGLLKNAKFNFPRQISFTANGKMYIADTGNSCIRMIDTTLPLDRATVNTPIGLPGARGYRDGGPEIAKFDRPCGVAVSGDGQIIYVADTHNKVIRKLSIE